MLLPALCPASARDIFFFNDTATPEISTLSLPDALPISSSPEPHRPPVSQLRGKPRASRRMRGRSEEHTSELHHTLISYAVFCLKTKRRLQRSDGWRRRRAGHGLHRYERSDG